MAAFSFDEQDNVITGPIREPRNSAINAGAGSIHDDATAKKLGFRGGTVAGSLHMEQFPPLMTEVFGEQWLRTGGMSLYFKYATTDGEPVQASAERAGPDQKKTTIWMDDALGNRVCEGTGCVDGPDLQSAVRQRIAALAEPGELRILENVEIGKPVQLNRQE